MFRSNIAVAAFGVALCLFFVGSVQAAQPAPPENPTRITDEQFVKNAALGGLTEVELGNLAMQKASNQDVKNLGQRLARDHRRLNDQLQDLAARIRLQVPTALDDKHQRIVERFSKMNGGQFERAFVNDQVKDHEKDIAQFEAIAKDGKDPAVREFATQALPILREHLKLAQAALSQVPAKP